MAYLYIYTLTLPTSPLKLLKNNYKSQGDTVCTTAALKNRQSSSFVTISYTLWGNYDI